MTPEEAKALLDGTTMGPWENTTGWSVDKTTGPHGEQGCGHIAYATSRQDADLIAAAPELAQLIAGMRYEYAVAAGPEERPVYATMNDQGKYVGTTLALADWWQTKGEAQSLVDELHSKHEYSTARVVRRLVGDPEVVS